VLAKTVRVSKLTIVNTAAVQPLRKGNETIGPFRRFVVNTLVVWPMLGLYMVINHHQPPPTHTVTMPSWDRLARAGLGVDPGPGATCIAIRPSGGPAIIHRTRGA